MHAQISTVVNMDGAHLALLGQSASATLDTRCKTASAKQPQLTTPVKTLYVQAMGHVLLPTTTPRSVFAALAIIPMVPSVSKTQRQFHHVKTLPAVTKGPV